MDKVRFNSVVSFDSAEEHSRVVELPVKELWGSPIKKIDNFPLREFAEVYSLIFSKRAQGRDYLGIGDYGDENGTTLIHLYNTKDDFVIDVIDGNSSVNSIGERVIANDSSLDYSCCYSLLSPSEQSDLSYSLRNLLSYCDNHNISDVYVVCPAPFKEHKLRYLCDYLIKNDKRSVRDYLESGLCEKDFKDIIEVAESELQTQQDVKNFLLSELSDMKGNMTAYVSKYNTKGSYVRHEAGSYCLLLDYAFSYFIYSETPEYRKFSDMFYSELRKRDLIKNKAVWGAYSEIKDKVWEGVNSQDDLSFFEKVFNTIIRDYI